MPRPPAAGPRLAAGRAILAAAFALGALARPCAAQGQLGEAAARGLELEQAGKAREAAKAYREAIRGADLIPGILGLERVYSALGWDDSMRIVIDF